MANDVIDELFIELLKLRSYVETRNMFKLSVEEHEAVHDYVITRLEHIEGMLKK